MGCFVGYIYERVKFPECSLISAYQHYRYVPGDRSVTE